VPDPIIRNPETATVMSEYNDVTPNFGDIMGSLVSESIKDADESLVEYSEEVDKAMAEAIKKAQDDGKDVSESDFKFDNWDLMEDFTEEDYDELDSIHN